MRPGSQTLHLHGMVLPGGSVQDVFVVDGRVTFTPAADAVTVVDGGYLVPGLVDAHAHLSLASPAGPGASADERVRRSAETQLAAGVLPVREPGSPDHASREVGPHAGLPRTVTAGRLLARPGRYFPGLARELEPDELPEAAAQEAAASGAWVKVIADFLTPGGAVTPSFPAEALTEAARRAHAAGARITAHATTPEVIDACLDAGFDAIEHGTMLRVDQLDRLAAAGVTLVPTLLIGDGILDAVRGFGGDGRAVAAMRQALDAQPAVVRQAAERGVTVLAGTDAGMVPHGLVAFEIGRLLAAGLTPELALGAGSWLARDYMGLPGIEEGAPADIVAFADDPRQDVEALRRPGRIVLDGRVVPDRDAAGHDR
jgi:imidazolonepropionase-like amidohydrolase